MSYLNENTQTEEEELVTQQETVNIIPDIYQTAVIEDYIDLPDGGKLYLNPIRHEEHDEIASAVENAFKNDPAYVERPFYVTVQPNKRTGEPGERVFWDAEAVAAVNDDEVKKTWAAYQKSLTILKTKTEHAVMFKILIDGTHSYVAPDGTEVDLEIKNPLMNPTWEAPIGWVNKFRVMGIPVPDNPFELKYKFVSALITTPTVATDIVMRCIELSLRGTLTVEAVARFRGQVRGALATQTEWPKQAN